ncbi:glycoside hydrolase family 9 protein [Adhaeribacter radiodurans]|uniref:Glycoside hydrolase family 9 protein n=1 Tax=Adhaeribacter radiodurans TaxID=2745197 RepID=A0A7L7L342_9BACT|nr:glycoside hydrolase family 9 protein [Adhaeribacter radiodurans]QMU26859.1 glycoside hydrolase family 9 protein [Adhaeribacter radiodurans]
MESRTILYNSVNQFYRIKNGYSGLSCTRYSAKVKKILLLLFFLNILSGISALRAQRLSRDLDVVLLTNQVGYLPEATKTVLTKGTEKRNFEVVEVTTGQVAYQGTLVPQPGDFGNYLTADFSKLIKEGRYYLRADTLRSFPFSISREVYQTPINMVIGYFSLQRCGASSTGYLTPCHVDDGIRFDNGKHQDVSGGWHDASDLRKWVSATIYGVMGLARTYELQEPAYQKAILEELRWGNQYFLKMQEPLGYVMDFIGGDLKKHSDNNRWTDNKIASGGTPINLVTPNAGTSKQLMLVAANHDDRIIQTQPVDMMAQYNFITSEALMARITEKIDPTYAKKCLEAAKKCYDWSLKSGRDSSVANAGAALQATIEMYKTTKQATYQKRAVELARQLSKMQAKSSAKEVSGFFYTALASQEPYKNIWNGPQAFIGLSDLVQLFPKDKDVALWKGMIKNYAENYLLLLAGKNSFNIVPWGLYDKKDPGGDRKAGKYWYRYFMEPEQEWWVGINSNLASAGVGLVKAAVVLKDDRMKAIAQKQLDWILGSNPFSSSTMAGVGYNHPPHFGGSSFLPNTPVLPGAVLNGLGGDHSDMPVTGKGDWQISEYWTPMVAYTLWLMAELSAGN